MPLNYPPRKYPHPGLGTSPEKLKLWEIRNQLEINLELMIGVCPVDEMTMKIFGHPLELMNSHVFDRLNELEKMIEVLRLRLDDSIDS